MRHLIVVLLIAAFIAPAALADEVTVSGESTIISGKTRKVIYDDDKSANNKEYFGWAIPNTATSAASWKIMRIEYTGNDFVVEWADGNRNYDNIWDDRATLTYQ